MVNINLSPKTTFIIFLSIFILLTGSAAAGPKENLFGLLDKNVEDDLKDIDQMAASLSKNPRVMSFINANMLDQDVDVIRVSIKDGNRVAKTYYIIRANDNKGQASITEKPPDKTGIVWTFRPTISQALKGLRLAIDTLSTYDKRHRSAFAKPELTIRLLQAVQLYFAVEKENVPPVNELIRNSTCSLCRRALRLIRL